MKKEMTLELFIDDFLPDVIIKKEKYMYGFSPYGYETYKAQEKTFYEMYFMEALENFAKLQREDARERAVKTFINWLGETDESQEGYINAFTAIYDKID